MQVFLRLQNLHSCFILFSWGNPKVCSYFSCILASRSKVVQKFGLCTDQFTCLLDTSLVRYQTPSKKCILFYLEAEASLGKLPQYLAPLSEASLNFSCPQIRSDACFLPRLHCNPKQDFSRVRGQLQYWRRCWQAMEMDVSSFWLG